MLASKFKVIANGILHLLCVLLTPTLEKLLYSIMLIRNSDSQIFMRTNAFKEEIFNFSLIYATRNNSVILCET